MITDADRKYINEIVWTEDNIPKVCAMDRTTAISQIRDHYQHQLPTEVAAAILDRLLDLGIVNYDSNSNIPFYISKKFDWIKYDSDQHIKYRYFALGACCIGSDSVNYNCIVEWDRISLTSLQDAIATEIKKLQKSKDSLITKVTIGNLVEVGYPKLKENSNGRE